MEAEDRVLDDGGQGQEVEQLGELLPHVGIAVLAQALIIEAIPEINQNQE